MLLLETARTNGATFGFFCFTIFDGQMFFLSLESEASKFGSSKYWTLSFLDFFSLDL